MRVHELAKELGLKSKDLIAQLASLNVEAKNHMVALSEDQVRLVRESAAATTPSSPVTVAAPAVEPAPEPAPVEEPEPRPEEAAAPAPVAETPAEPEEVEEAPKEEEGPKTIIVRGGIVVKDFAVQLGLRPNQLIAELMGMNIFASINERIELKVAQRLATKHGVVVEHEKKTPEHKPVLQKPKVVEPEKDKPEDMMMRPPVVAFLGHVDHGKTSLLDQIRRAKVAQGEDGGITQHIGAYSVEFQDHRITFLDTPGHAAFTAMRARGANLTDIVVLIVAADDGIMPQTREAIQHARAADVTIMVAINKIDLPGANVDRVLQQLQEEGLPPEQWGGQVVCCPVSAETGEGIDHLLEMITLQSEVLELTANPARRGEGYVIEAKLEPGRGPTATVLVRRGTLHVGDAVICGPCWGKIKALINDKGIKVRTAGPSTAVQCLGLTDVPEAGAKFSVAENDREARQSGEELQAQIRTKSLAVPKRASLDELLAASSGPDTQELALVVKADVQGSLEAIVDSLKEIKSEKISLKFVLTGVGNISGNDILLASASNAIVIGFHVSQDAGAGSTAKREGVEVRLYSIIYELFDDVREAMTGLLAPATREKVLGHAEIRQVFDISKRGRIAGCMVVDGQATAKAKARLKRGGEVIYEGRLASLKRFQNDATSVRDGQECGIRLDRFMDIEVNDIIELYEMEEVAQQL